METLKTKLHHIKFILFISLISLIQSNTFSQSTDSTDDYQVMTKIYEVQINYIAYIYYGQPTIKRLDISDLIISKKAIGKGNPLPYVYNEVPDFKLLFLEEGLARLRDPINASDSYKAAEENAKKQQKGIWSDGSSKENNPNFSLKYIFELILKWLPWLVSIGIVGAIAKYIRKKFYIERRVRLLIIGEPSAGKTALYLRISDPNVDKKKILLLEASKSLDRYKAKNFIPKGKFEIYPILSDIPGSAFSTVWEQLSISRSHAVVLVLAHSKLNKSSDGKNLFDDKFINIQLGYVQAYIQGGIVATAKKPKVIIVFINKFDLLSAHHPDDKNSQEACRQIEQIFKEHIESAHVTEKRTGVPVKILLGSALENWNSDRILDIVAKRLYE